MTEIKPPPMEHQATEPLGLAEDLHGTAYRWVKVLAQGGMGDVCIVEHIELGERRVMKVLKRELLSDAHFTERLRAEARILVSMRHPRLVEVRDFGFTKSGRAFLVTELLQGLTLREAVAQAGHFSVPKALDVVRQTLEGLVVVHERGFVHRDLKPDNLFLVDNLESDEPSVKILDFGVAKVLGADTRLEVGLIAATQTGIIIGTPAYLAPEQILARPVSAKTDIYALGCVLYHMLASRAPFAGRSQLKLLEAHVFEMPVSLATLRGVPAEVDAFILRALAKDPAARFDSARDMLRELAILREKLASTSPAVAPPAAAKPVARRGGTVPMNAVAPLAIPLLGFDSPRPVQPGPVQQSRPVQAEPPPHAEGDKTTEQPSPFLLLDVPSLPTPAPAPQKAAPPVARRAVAGPARPKRRPLPRIIAPSDWALLAVVVLLSLLIASLVAWQLQRTGNL